MPGAVKEGLPPVIKDLIRWRHRNGLSQRGASEVMQARGLDVKIGALKQWEQGVREPGSLAVKALRDFLKAHPRIENPPRYRPGPK
jgi:DNA-binding transcriptional regulator YiaG